MKQRHSWELARESVQRLLNPSERITWLTETGGKRVMASESKLWKSK